MSEICVEKCAVNRDCSGFEPKADLRLSNMPRFPETKGMTKEEKFTLVTIYLAKIVDHLQGIEALDTLPSTRWVVHNSRRLLSDIVLLQQITKAEE